MQANPFLGQILRASAPGYAAIAAQRFIEQVPDASDRYGNGAFELWRANLAARLAELAVALTDATPDRFAEQLAWSRIAFRTRGVPEADLRRSLECLREVLRQELPADGQASVEPYFEVAEAGLSREIERSETLLEELNRETGGTPAAQLARRYVYQILAGEAQAARQLVIDAVKKGDFTAEAAMLDVLMPALRILGRLWHLNEVDVGVEHFGTVTTKETLAQLQLFVTPQDSLERTALIATAPNDGHDLGTLMTARFFELDGWRVVHLGADLPSDELPACIERFAPDVVILSATLDEHRRGLTTGIERVLQELNGGRPQIIVGGPAFGADPELWRLTGADATATSPPDACAVARKLLELPERPSPE